MTKTIGAARQQRERSLMDFKAACEDLEEEIAPLKSGTHNERRVKTKMKLVRSSYDDVMTAQAQLVSLEKTSGAEETNWNWVKTNVRKPFKDVIEKAEDVLIALIGEEDPEKETKALVDEAKRDAKCELVRFEATAKAMVEGLEKAVGETNIWLPDNHEALTGSVDKIYEDLNRKHLDMGRVYLKYLGETDVETEVKRQEKFVSDNMPKVSGMKAKLLANKPAARAAGPGPAHQQGQGGHVGAVQQGVIHHHQNKSKPKMAAMSIPKFTGKVVDYPEWRKLFKDCVESQYEESATVMILRNQALPESLTNLVPRCAELSVVWTKLDKKFLDPTRVWKGIKADLASLDRKRLGNTKYMVALVGKILDAESLLDTVGMVHWLRQEDKIPEYEDLLIDSEKLRWVEMKPKLTGTPWENFKCFLIKMSDIYEEMAKTGTVETEEQNDKKPKCDFCKKWYHTEADCRLKKEGGNKPDGKRKCFKCGSENHIARDCPDKSKLSSNRVNSNSKVDTSKKEEDHESYSNYLRSKDCRWCNRTYNSTFTCSGCNIQWAAKSKADHCLAHCTKFAAASARERGEMVIKGQNCLICLHHEHATDSCFGKDQLRSICGMGGCKKRHHPSLHGAPQPTVQAVQVANHLLRGDGDTGDINPGVKGGDLDITDSALVSSILGVTGPQGKFISRVNERRLQCHKLSWSQDGQLGGTEQRLAEQRQKELLEMKELLRMPVVEGHRVLLLMQNITVKYGPRGELTEITVFWDDGSTCSLVLTSTAEMLGCPGEPVTVSIETVNGVVTRETKLYCVELMSNTGDRVVIKAFGVENVSEVRSIVDLSMLKHRFSDEVQTQWCKVAKRPRGVVHLLVGQEYAGYHPVQYEAHENLVVCRTMFGQGWMLTGTDQQLQSEECSWGEEVAAMRVGRVTVINQSNHRVTVSQVRLTYTQERDFYTMDDLGIEPARRCPGCKGCKECSWRGQELSRQEAFELEYIEKCVQFKDGKFHVQFPFLVDPRELADNYNQVVRIAQAEERKLEREGRMKDFNDLFQKLQDLGAMEEISEHELRSWTGPVHYVSLQHVINEDSATTSFRIVSNSSLKTPGNPHTLNSILAKGPNMLSDPYKILIRFRTYLRGLNSDVTKAYYQMVTGLLEKHVRRVVWRYGDKRSRWRIFGYLCVSFGDTPAAALLEICFRIAIAMFGEIDLVAAHRLLHDRFVDDITSGGDVDEVQRFKGFEDPETLACDGTMPQVLGKANLILKAIAVSGEADGGALEKLSGTVLGHGYSTSRDILTIKYRVNVSPRKRGMATGQDITRETVGRIRQSVLSRRIVLGVVNAQFDMMGIASPLLIKLRVAMRDLFIQENNLDWDTVLTGTLWDTWCRCMEELVTMGQLDFARCVKPEGAVEEFWLIVFFDASDHAYAAVVYCRWRMEDGTVIVRLLCSKARVAPLKRQSTPRLELNGAVVGMRLLWTVVQALEHEGLPTKVLVGGDSETVLAAREKATGALGEFFGNRIGECWDLQEKIAELVPVGISGLGEWYHMASQENAADRPTRLDSRPEDVAIGSEWQEGPSYLRRPFSEWPWERNFADRKLSEVLPREEFAAKYKGLPGKLVRQTTERIKHEENPIMKKFDDGFITNDYDKLIQMTEPLFRWTARMRSGKMRGSLTLTSREMAVLFWFRVSMTATRKAVVAGRLKELTLQEEQGMLVIRGRAVSGMLELLGAEYLPVVMSSTRIAVLIMLKSHHDSDHKSVDITLYTSRHYCWVVGGRKLAKTVCKFCVRCRYVKKKLETQKMAPLPKELCVPCPAFSNVGLDLAGPYKVTSMLRRKSTRSGQGTMKVWALLVMCLNTRALKIYLAAGYGTQDFLVAWNEFESDCGVPRRVHSDRGSQLVSAAGAVEGPDYDWDAISARSKGQTVWTFCPSGAQWRNGAIESFVKRFKWSLEMYEQSELTYAELQSDFKGVAAVLNSRPISARYGPRHAETDPDYLEMLTPNMLLTARTGVDLPVREYNDDCNPARRLAFKQELESAWWERWKVQCFDSLLPTKSWTVQKRGVKQGDVVLISYSEKSKSGTFRLGIVEQVEVDDDGLVRTCTVGYRLVRSDLPPEEQRLYYKGLKYKQIRVPVQRLCVILPIEEQKEPGYLTRGGQDDQIVKDDFVEEKNVVEESGDEEIVDGDTTSRDLTEVVNVDEVEMIEAEQIAARAMLVKNFRATKVKTVRIQQTNRSVQMLHRKFAHFVKLGWC